MREGPLTDPRDELQALRFDHLREQNIRQQGEIDRLAKEVQGLKDERNVLLGMSKSAKFVVGVIVTLAGWGAFGITARVVRWMNAPLILPH